MTKQQFLDFLGLLKSMYDQDTLIGQGFEPYFSIIPKFNNFELGVKLFTSFFPEHKDIIEYFIYDLEFGKNWKPGCIKDEDTDIVLVTFNDLLNYVYN